MSRSKRPPKRPGRAAWLIFSECDCWRCMPGWLKKRRLLDRAQKADDR